MDDLVAAAEDARLRRVVLPDLMVVEDVAAFLWLSPASVRRLIREGRIPAAKLGRRWIVERRSLLDALEEARRVPRWARECR